MPEAKNLPAFLQKHNTANEFSETHLLVGEFEVLVAEVFVGRNGRTSSVRLSVTQGVNSFTGKGDTPLLELAPTESREELVIQKLTKRFGAQAHCNKDQTRQARPVRQRK